MLHYFLLLLTIFLPTFGITAPTEMTSSSIFQRSAHVLHKEHSKDLLAGCHPKKRYIYEQILSRAQEPDTTITISAHSKTLQRSDDIVTRMALSCAKAPGFTVSSHQGFFPYKTAQPEKDAVLVTLNFADDELFGYYKTGLLAQDELQVLEFPELAMLREYFKSHHPEFLNAQKNSLIFHNIRRQAAFDTQKVINGKKLYGNAFQRASQEELDQALMLLDQQKNATILPIVAPFACANKIYTPQLIEGFLHNVILGFSHAKEFTNKIGHSRLIIHTGGLGTGAFGHNIIASIFLQLVAAQCVATTDSHLERFHVGFYGVESRHIEAAQSLFEEFQATLQKQSSVSSALVLNVIERLFAKYNITPHAGTGE